MNETTKNIIYVMLQQSLLLVLPLLTLPYVSRVLGPHDIGLAGYSNSVLLLFVNIALLGSELYGVREIAKAKNDKEKLAQVFSGIFFLRVLLLFTALVIYFVCIYFLFDNRFIFYLQSLNLIAYMVDVNWFFQGMEQFKKILMRNIAVKLISFLSIFIFVRDRSDLYLYVAITAVSILSGNALLIINIKKYVPKFGKVSAAELRDHMRYMLSLFMAGFSIMIYLLIDKIMLGFFSTPSAVGYYEQGQKIVNVAVNLVSAFCTVLLPKSSFLIAGGNENAARRLVNQSIVIINFIILPVCTIFFAVSSDFIPWFLGDAFQDSVIIAQVLAPIIYIKAIGIMFGAVYFIPKAMNREYTFPLVIGAIVNVGLNLALIPVFGATGSASATLATESLILLIQIVILRKVIDRRYLMKHGFLNYALASVIVMGAVLWCRPVWHFESRFANVVCYSAASAIGYVILLIAMRDKLLKALIAKFFKMHIRRSPGRRYQKEEVK